MKFYRFPALKLKLKNKINFYKFHIDIPRLHMKSVGFSVVKYFHKIK